MTFTYQIGNHDGAIETIPEISSNYPESDKRTGHRKLGARYQMNQLSGKLAVLTPLGHLSKDPRRRLRLRES
jgi:hypothetical protein